jgi:hypothetical protein
MPDDITELSVPALIFQPRTVIQPTDYADILEGQYDPFSFRLRPTAEHRYLDGDGPTGDPLEDLIRRGFGG